MEQTVYIDLYFLINFSMDLLCFLLVSKLLSYKLSITRILAASVFGGVYACLSLFFGVYGIWSFILDTLALVFMSVIAIMKKGALRQSAIYTVVYAAVSIVLGGFMTVLFSAFNKIGLDRLLGNENDADGVSVWIFAILAIVGGICSAYSTRFFRRKSARRECRVKIVFGQNQTVLHGLCDSGNLLREPVFGKLCIVAEREIVERILPEKIKKIIRGELLCELGEYSKLKISIIPTATVNGEGILYAVMPDSLSINMGNGWCEVDAFVALGEINSKKELIGALVPTELTIALP